MIQEFCFYNTNDAKLYSYPNLFHKQILNQSQLHSSYEIIQMNLKSKEYYPYICHLHIQNIDRFHEFYSYYYKELCNSKFSTIVITFSSGTKYNEFCKPNITILKVKNIGMDIGPKIIFQTHLNLFEINYKYSMFLHSKSNPTKRSLYMSSLFRNLDIFYDLENKNYGAFTLSMLHNTCLEKNMNSSYIEEMTSILDLKSNTTYFPEGNMYILHQSISKHLFQTNFYFCLNSSHSFDYNWFKIYHNKKNTNLMQCYKLFNLFKLSGSNLSLTSTDKKLPDSMIEHVFERMIFKCTLHFQKDVFIFDKNLAFISKFNELLRCSMIPTKEHIELKSRLICNEDSFSNLDKNRSFSFLKTYKKKTIEKVKKIWKKDLILLKNFNPENYKNRYPDLQKNLHPPNRDNLLIHYVEHGFREARIID